MSPQQAFTLALQHHQAGRLAEAEALYRQILSVQPGHSDALHLLGAIALVTGNCEAALALISRADAAQPSHPVYLSNMGEAHRRLGHADEAIACLRRALALQPEFPDALTNLGSAFAQKEQWPEAVACFQRAATLMPDHAGSFENLSLAFTMQGLWMQAVESLRRVLALRPSSAEAHNNLGHALLLTGQWEEAAACCRRATELRPIFIEALNHLGIALTALGRLDDAADALQNALRLQPGCAVTHNNLGNMLRDRGDLDESIAAFRRALEFDPHCVGAHDNLLYSLHFHPRGQGADNGESLAAEHRRWGELHAEPSGKSILPHGNDRNPARKLRIGYVSPDFRSHSVACFIEGLLAAHDRAQAEVFCYADLAREDGTSARLRSHVEHWRSITGMSDEKVARLIRADAIDILVDLAGHTSGNRLLVFARKPAPIQVTWLGYCDTTGIAAMDFRLTDAHADPPGATGHLHTEKLVRLPDGAWCFRQPDASPPVAALPAAREGHITFGCFGTRAKMNDEMFAVWSGLLLEVPGSRLLLKNLSFREPSLQRRVREVFTDAGITPERIEFLGWLPAPGDHLAAYERMDIALDTFPYHGTTTTCEALWMGVPVITLAGRTHASRVGVSLLSNIGLHECIAENADDYIRIAAQLSRDLPRLTQLRTTLRHRMAASPLMDATRFARHVEAACRQMWTDWCIANPV